MWLLVEALGRLPALYEWGRTAANLPRTYDSGHKKTFRSRDVDIAKFGTAALAELQRLCHMAHERPNLGEWRAFYARLMKLIIRNVGKKDTAGIFARILLAKSIRSGSSWKKKVFLQRITMLSGC